MDLKNAFDFLSSYDSRINFRLDQYKSLLKSAITKRIPWSPEHNRRGWRNNREGWEFSDFIVPRESSLEGLEKKRNDKIMNFPIKSFFIDLFCHSHVTRGKIVIFPHLSSQKSFEYVSFCQCVVSSKADTRR